jgi:signal transduction histidine kinase
MRNLGEKEDKIVLEIVLFSTLFLSIKYGRSYFNIEPVILYNIPLLVAYIKERKVSIFVISMFIIIYYIEVLKFSPILIVSEYLAYAVIYLGIKKKGLTNSYLINTFVIIKAGMLSFQTFYFMEHNPNNLLVLGDLFIAIITFYILSYLILALLNQCENTINLNISIKELEKEKQLKNSLFKITHEIKNPMAVCKGYLDMLDVNNKDHVEKYIPIIKQEIDRTLTLLDDFSEITKIKIKKEELDINLLVDDVANAMESLFKNNNIECKLNIPDTEIYLLGDYNRLKQVFMNIIKNAIEAIPNDKSGVIEISTKLDKKNIYVYIKDNGVGMDEEQLKKIEEAFYTTKNKGSGLGLFLSKEIIEAHDGKIIYDSIKDEGTTVTIKLPLNYKI